MCVIVSQPAGSHMDKARAKRLWKTNSDGGGFAFINAGGDLEVFKSMEFEPYWKAFEQARSANSEQDFLMHMRIQTHGNIDIATTHPYRVDEHTVMAHNGIIAGVRNYHDGRSDTQVFISDVLSMLDETWLDDEVMVKMIEDFIGWSKLMFVTTNPKLKKGTYILNEKKGTVVEGMWFSNTAGVHEPEKKWRFEVNGKKKKTPGTPASLRRSGVTKTKVFDRDLGKWVEKEEPTPSEDNPKVTGSGSNVYPIKSSHVDDSQEYLDYLEACQEADRKREEQEYGEQTFMNWLDDDGVAITKKVARKAMMKLRKENWLTKPFVYMDGGYECLGCDETIDITTGECACWDKVCLDCESWACECTCSMGYSTTLRYGDKVEAKVLERVNLNLEMSLGVTLSTVPDDLDETPF